MTQLSLTNPRLVEYNGICYLLGTCGGTAYLMKSADCAESWLAFSGGSTQSAVGPCDEHGGALVKLHSQGCRLLVALPHQSQIHIYMSADDGDTWSLDSILGGQ